MSAGVGERFEKLVEIMRALRAPDGCPWDREQTHASLRPFLLEETYEALEAIDSGSPMHLCEELGDVLFEVVFMSRISEETGDFTIADTIDAISTKLVRRHPHVFARQTGDSPLTSSQVIEKWETLKARERAESGRSVRLPPSPEATADRRSLGVGGQADPEPPKTKTTLSGVPKTLPSLLRAYEISSRAAAVGFDWARPADVLDKIEEEVDEVRREVESGATDDRSRAEEEMGDLLFAIANLSRKLGIEPESALRKANEKFTRRFEAVEAAFTSNGRAMSDASLDEMEAEWQRVKATKETETRGHEEHQDH